MDKKTKLITIGISVFVLLVLVANVAYSFFSSLINTTNNIDVSINTANGSYIFTVDGGSDVNFNINFNDIQSNTVSNSVPVKNNSTNLNVSLYSPEGVTTTCTYDIIWTWDTSNGYSQYTTSSMGTIPHTYDIGGTQTTFDKEFAVGIKLNNNDVLPLKDFSLLSTTGAVTALKKGAKISSYNGNTTKNSYGINTQIFNLPIDQTAIKGKKFSGKISVDNVNCKMTEGEVESPIHLVSGDGTNVGDKICIGDSDCFYVVENDGTNIQMLSEFLLDSSSRQSENDYLLTYFSNTNYFAECTGSGAYKTCSIKEKYNILPEGDIYNYIYDENSNLSSYITNYVNNLNDTYDIDVIGKLIEYNQMESLGCEQDKMGMTCTNAPEWSTNYSYWTGSIIYDPNMQDYAEWVVVFAKTALMEWYYNTEDGFGIRPIITISASLIDN